MQIQEYMIVNVINYKTERYVWYSLALASALATGSVEAVEVSSKHVECVRSYFFIRILRLLLMKLKLFEDWYFVEDKSSSLGESSSTKLSFPRYNTFMMLPKLTTRDLWPNLLTGPNFLINSPESDPSGIS